MAGDDRGAKGGARGVLRVVTVAGVISLNTPDTKVLLFAFSPPPPVHSLHAPCACPVILLARTITSSLVCRSRLGSSGPFTSSSTSLSTGLRGITTSGARLTWWDFLQLRNTEHDTQTPTPCWHFNTDMRARALNPKLGDSVRTSTLARGLGSSGEGSRS
jgi:hypothetical protein